MKTHFGSWLQSLVNIHRYKSCYMQWRSHRGGKGGQGGRVPPLTAKNLPKIGKNRKKREKIGKNRQNSGSFFHFAPPDR